MHISLRSGERIYINGAVVRVDRKVSMEFLNDVTFLLESHVLLAEHATTPLRQLYFIVQTMLIEPSKADEARAMYEKSRAALMVSFKNPDVLAGLERVHQQITSDKVFDALKTIRMLYPIEEAIMGRGRAA
jgi:flagellar protein FlbT